MNKKHHLSQPATPSAQSAIAADIPKNLRLQRRSTPIRAFLWRWKPVCIAAILLSFGHAIITTLAPAEKTFAEIIIAKKDLAAGTKITEEHISLSKVEPNSEIAEENLYTKSSELIGETLAAPIPRGLAITKTQILSNNFISLAPQGTVISAVNISQELSTELLEPGQYIDLYAPATLLSNNIENITQAESVTEAKLLGENILIIGKFKTQEKSPMFGEVANNTVLYLAIPEDTASVVLGVQAKTPLQAVVRKK